MLKRSLALGALMAFVITGSAFAEVTNVGDQYRELRGTVDSVDATNIVGTNCRVVGGWSGKNNGLMTAYHSTDLTVNGGNWQYVIAGSYLSGIENPKTVEMSIKSTKATINDGVNIRHVVGGTAANDVNELKVNSDRTAHIVINGGTFGLKSDWESGSTLESLVVGGDHIKGFADSTDGYDNHCDIKLDSALTEIKGGVFNSLVIGGSLANQYGAKIGSGVFKTYVGRAETIITGGTFNQPIVAGGVAKGGEAISNVGEAILSISNATVNADIFASGMVCYGDTNGTEGADVETSIVTIKDSTIKNVYNTRGFFGVENNKWKFWAEDEKFPSGSSAEGFGTEEAVTELELVNTIAEKVDITEGSVELRVEGDGSTSVKELVTGTDAEGNSLVALTASADGEANDAAAGDYEKIANNITIGGKSIVNEDGTFASGIEEMTIEEGEVAKGMTVTQNEDGTVSTVEKPHQGNTGIKDIVATGLISWRYEMNDMNKRMGELRNANGEHGVWVRMVRGETEYNSVKNQYNQYQLGYDEKLSVDPSWTVGVALSYTEADNNFSKGTGESTNKALSIYGSKLNDDGTFIDLIAKYARLENDFDLGTAKGDYDTNGYSFSAEYGKRIQQGNGLWIEPQVELTYGQVDGATYMVGGRTVNQDNMESLIGRVGFSLGKDISKGNVYARASYLYDFEGETSATFSKDAATDSFEQDLGGGWWEVGVGANINLSKATYIYADIEKTFGGEVDTNWQWNLGVRYSF